MQLPDFFTQFSRFDKYMIGYDHMLEKFYDLNEQIGKVIPNWPPYNIRKIEENKYIIEMAVAGFGSQDIEVTLDDSILRVKGSTESQFPTQGEKGEVLYKGIADRTFVRDFTLADTIEVKNAELVNGMLRLFLENVIPESKKPKKIEVKAEASDPFTSVKPQLLNEKAA